MKTTNFAIQVTACILLAAFLSIAAPVQALNETPVFSIMGESPIQEKITTTDSDQLFTAAFQTAHTASGGGTIDFTTLRAAFCTCEDNDIRIAYGRSSGQGGSRMGDVVPSGSSFRLPSTAMIKAAHIISKTSGQAGVLFCTVEF